ncbi:SpoIIE family protein phosphatase [Flammeovirga sp. MY04]|uniref:two-component regulator propeller domain-containing protein n=1 Tax=Flammeovirga sp. MY04 TaxID=1191459 RepID=UPI00082576B6|nr:two-component regulator propeller domain-containing protein [Flammeovirga sp. MY04]ANQ47994.2 SpoIIE family protein phosphatase [Flammeovirga sp. MY04]
MHRLLFCFLSFLFCSASIFGQQYNISSFGIHDGLSQNNCNTLIKANNGAILIGTLDAGININNGQSFNVFDVRNGLSNNFVNDFELDERGGIWVATNNGLNYIYNRKIKSYIENDTQSFRVQQIAFDKNLKTVWGVTLNHKLFRLTSYYKLDPFEGNPKITYTAIASDEDGLIWVGTKRQGLFVYKGDSIVQQYNIRDNITTIQHLSNQRIALGTTDGVVIYNKKNFSKGAFKILKSKKVRCMAEDSQKNLWVGTTFNGVYITKGIKIKRNISKENGLARQINDIEEDDDGGIWLATKKGLYRYNNDIYTLYAKNFSIASDILETYQSFDTTTVLGSERALTFIKNDKFSGKVALPLSTRSLDIIQDKKGRYIIGSDYGVYRLENGFWKNLSPKEKNDINEYPSTFFEKNNSIYVCALNHIYEIKEDSLKEVVNLNQYLQNYRISKGVVSPIDKSIWLGTMGKGLVYLDTAWNVKKIFQKKDKSIPSLYINDLKFDKEGQLWIATSESGICKIRDINSPAISFQEENLSSTNIRTINIDQKGNIWAGSNTSINHLISLENDIVRIERYGADEGFSALGYERGSGSIDPEGNLWFGTEDGAVKINPNHQVYSTKTPKILYKNVLVFSDNIPWEDYSEGIDPDTHLPINAILPPEYNHLTINFVGISMNVPNKIKYQWKLEGFDDNFCPPTSNNQAVYTKLPPGDYNFILRAVNAGGVTSEDERSFSFKIDKPFYQKRSVIALFTLSLLFIIFYFFYYYLKQERDQKEILQKKVDERTREIVKARERVEKTKNEIEQKSEELEVINTKVRKSIQYAATIQKALIGCDHHFVDLFPRSFNLTITKSEVTGDFVWMHENDQYIFLLLIDCTNHGVPAALISIVGNQLLEQIIHDNENITGAELLTKLDSSLKEALKIDANTLISDGMDIACCRFEKGTRKINFAGARRPLIIIENGELRTIKSNFCSIGIVFNDVTPQFDNIDFELNEEATIYLFSDGFANQFNAEGEKFKKVQFKKLLIEVSSLPMAEQCKKLHQIFHDWKEGVEQDDDMMVVGFKYDTNYAESERDHKIIREVERS